jgi:hypothetical protein
VAVPSGLILTYTPDEPPVVIHQLQAMPLPRPGSGLRFSHPMAPVLRRCWQRSRRST